MEHVGVDDDGNFAMIDGFKVPHGSIFRQLIDALKKKEKISKEVT